MRWPIMDDMDVVVGIVAAALATLVGVLLLIIWTTRITGRC